MLNQTSASQMPAGQEGMKPWASLKMGDGGNCGNGQLAPSPNHCHVAGRAQESLGTSSF